MSWQFLAITIVTTVPVSESSPVAMCACSYWACAPGIWVALAVDM